MQRVLPYLSEYRLNLTLVIELIGRPANIGKEMDIRTYTDWTKTTAIYPKEQKDPQVIENMYLALGLTGEAGEVAEAIKKLHRDGTANSDNLKKELGDVIWYWSRLCAVNGFDPEVLLSENFMKLESRKERGVLGGSGDNR